MEYHTYASKVWFFNLSIPLPNLTTPKINRSKGNKKSRCPIPGANNVTVDNGPNNLGNPIKMINGNSQLKYEYRKSI